MKKLTILSGLVIFLLMMMGQARADITIAGSGTGTGVVTDASCQQTKFYSLGVLCQDTATGKLYKGTGAYIEEVASAGVGAGNVVGAAASTDSELPLFSGVSGQLLKRSNTLTGMVFVQSGVVGVDTSANTRAMLGLGTAATAPSGNFMAAVADVSATSFTTPRTSYVATGDLKLLDQTAPSTGSAGFIGPAEVTGNTSYRIKFPDARATTPSSFLSATNAGEAGDGTSATPYIQQWSWVQLYTIADISNNFATKATTLAGYNIADGRTKTQLDSSNNAIFTVLGVANDATTLGTFTGTTIPDNQDIKTAFQTLESAFEGLPGGHTQNTDTGTTGQTFQLQSGASGFKLKNNSGTGEIRNAADGAYAPFKASTIDGTTITGTGDVSGNSLHASTVHASGSIVSDGTITASGDSSANTSHASTYHASGSVTADGDVSGNSVHGSHIHASGNVLSNGDVSGNTVNTSTLTVSGDASTNTSHASTYHASGSVTSNGDVSGNTVHGSELHSSGVVTANGDVSGNSVHGSTFHASGSIQSDGTLNITGQITGSADASINTIHTSTIHATGDVSANTMYTSGTLTAAAVNISRVAGQSSYVDLYEVPANGNNKVTLKPNDTLAADYTVTLPSATGTLVTGAGTSGKLAKFSDTNTIADGPVVGTTFTDSKWCQFTTANGLQCDQNTPAGAGDVTGGATSADGELAAYNGTGGKTIKQSYIAFSGPSTSVKTKTISNANDTIAELGQANTFSAKQTFGDASVNTSLQVMLTAGTNLNNQLLARDPSDNKVKTVLDPSVNSVRAVTTVTAGGNMTASNFVPTNAADANGEFGYQTNIFSWWANSEDWIMTASANLWTFNSNTSAAFHFTPKLSGTDASFNTSLQIPLTATTGAGAHNALEDASAQILVRSAVDNKIKALTYYGPRYIDASASVTLSTADTQSVALVIDVSPTTTTNDTSVNLSPILGKVTGCQFQGGVVNILQDSSNSIRIGFHSTDNSQNFMIVDASGNADTTSLHKNVYVENPSNEMVIAFWGKPVTIGGATPGSYCVWAVKMVATNKVVAGTAILNGSGAN